MSTPMALIAAGDFVSDGTAKFIELPSRASLFTVRNRSIWGTNPVDLVVAAEWARGYSAGQATTTLEAATGLLSASLIAAGGNGFTEVNDNTLDPGAPVTTGTQINQAAPAVVLDATSPAVGDIVRLFNVTGMVQVGGLEFTVTAVNAGVSYTLGYLDSSAFAAVATNVDYRVLKASRYSPTKRWITGITSAASAEITLSVTHGYSVGDIITVNVPDASFGMTEINGKTAKITAVNTTTNTITVDIDSTGFTAFAFPASAVAALGVTFPMVVPVGEISGLITAASTNASNFGMIIGSDISGSNTDIIDWRAFAADLSN